MQSFRLQALGLAVSLAFSAGAFAAPSLQDAAKAFDVANAKSIEYSGTGRWFQFGQAPAPNTPWPPFDVKSYTADVNFDAAAARVQIARLQQLEPPRVRPDPVEQKVDQYVFGTTAWNVPTNGTGNPTSQPAAVEERSAEILATPQGFIKAALANKANSKPVKDGVEVNFLVGGKYRYVGTFDAKNQLIDVKTWIDNPILGDTLVETKFSDYKDFGGVQFPAHIVRTQGGYPVLDLNVTSVKANPAVDISVPEAVAKNPVPAITVKADKVAEGVYYLTGGTHHSVLVVQRDHVVVIEAPLNEDRSKAVIAKVKEIAPGKPIQLLVNTHAHFDHSGGLRTYVAEGATIVTHAGNKDYYQKVWGAAHTLNPDALAKAKKAAKFETFSDKHVITDGNRKLEIYPIAGSGHNDAFALIYLPEEKILIEADAYTPLAANAPVPAKANPYSVNLYQNIQKLNLDVKQILALHGPGVVKLDDLRTYIGQK